jgi:hypothetical protein
MKAKQVQWRRNLQSGIWFGYIEKVSLFTFGPMINAYGTEAADLKFVPEIFSVVAARVLTLEEAQKIAQDYFEKWIGKLVE